MASSEMKQLMMHTFKQTEQLTTVDFGERECSVKAEKKDGDTESSEDLRRTRSALGYLSIDELIDETEKLTGISTGRSSNHDIALHPADLEVSSSAELKMTDLGVEVLGLGFRTEEHLKEAQKPRAARLWGSLKKKLQRVASPSNGLESATSAKVQSKSPVLDPRWLPDLALAGLRRKGGEWYENNARGGDGHSGNDLGYGEGQEGRMRLVVMTEKESGYQDARKDDTDPDNQAHMEQLPGNAGTVSKEESPSEVSRAASIPNARPDSGRNRDVLTF